MSMLDVGYPVCFVCLHVRSFVLFCVASLEKAPSGVRKTLLARAECGFPMYVSEDAFVWDVFAVLVVR